MTSKTIYTLLAATLCFLQANGKVTMPKMFSDGMVLQQKSQASLWGWADKGRTVKITTSWDKKRHTTKSAHDGKWKCAIPTPEAGGPYTITLDDGEKTIISDILIGEVWMCSGQSNMEMTMKGFKGQPVEGVLISSVHRWAKSQVSRPKEL